MRERWSASVHSPRPGRHAVARAVGGGLQRGDEAVVALAGGSGAAEQREREDRAHRAHRTDSCSAATCRSAPAKTSGSWAPETPYRPSITKNGTPLIPYATACAM